MRYSIKTLGCKVNQVDSLHLAETLEELGLKPAMAGERAEVCIVNTCTVTARTDTQCRQLIRRAVKENPDARVIVTGCYAEIAPETVRSISGVDLILGNMDKRRSRDILSEDLLKHAVVLPDQAPPSSSEPSRNDDDSEGVSGMGRRSRAFVRVQDGCRAFCAYCIVPYVRGPLKSEAPESVEGQVLALVQKGFPEIVLTGIHLGAYGVDWGEEHGLTRLLSRLMRIPGDFRIRLSSIEPGEIDSELMELVAGEEKICNHLHIPLQSGDNAILKRMKRPYTREEFSDLVFALRDKDPEMGIGTDLIVGFPGETHDSFEKSCEWLSGLPLTHFHVFPYSQRPGTEAASMQGQVETRIKKERAARLRRLCREIRGCFLDRMMGKTLSVVAISAVNATDEPLKVLTSNYLEGLLPQPPSLVSGIFSVKFSTVSDDKLLI